MWFRYIALFVSFLGSANSNQEKTCEDEGTCSESGDIYKCFIDDDNARVCPETIAEIDDPPPFIAVPKTVLRPKQKNGFFGKSRIPIDHNNDRQCDNKHRLCEQWAAEGECKNNPNYMNYSCASACSTCRYLTSEWRCRIDPELPAFVHPHDVDRMFENMIVNFTKYKPVVMHRNPWVVVLDEFLTLEECEGVLAVGAKNLKRSVDAGEMTTDGKFKKITTDKRTSENSWCLDDCYRSDTVQQVNRKMTEVTGIPQENFEYLQVLRYMPGQYYAQHHDYIPGHVHLPIGPRVYTFFLYLSEVEEGGETRFNKLGIKVKPKPGRAVIWPSVYSNNPFAKDARTDHEAMPVKKGVKFGANAWIHMFNFHDALEMQCSG